MILEQIFQQSEAYFEPDKDIMFKKKWSSIPATTSDNTNGCFECNICLDSAHDPVVTLCGHLYCWQCIYKWINIYSSSSDPDQKQQNCPVCNAEISHSSLVPLYGRGTSSSLSESKQPLVGLIIPGRPRPIGLNALISSESQTFNHRQYLSRPYGLGGFATTSVYNPTIGMIGEMVYTTMFGNSSGTSLFAYPNSDPHMANTSPRMRRNEMQIEKSLNRLSIFLFCCFICCLLLF